jgi:N-acetylglucosamine kinase-like BadF-type ATPase
VLDAITALVEPVAIGPARFDTVVLGLASIDSHARAQEVAGHVASLVQARQVVVAVDAVAQFAGALGGRSGAVMVAGTGAIALAVADDGSFRRSDGWGYMLGDDGSGFAIGRQGLASALRFFDGRGGSKALATLAAEAFGPLDDLQDRVYAAPSPVKEVASFAPSVAAAARAGDTIAAAIWADAARQLAHTTLAAMTAVFQPNSPVHVSWAGGLFGVRSLLLEPYVSHITSGWPNAEVRPPVGDALQGAWFIAASRSGTPVEGLVYRFRDARRGS